jgi:hypothetical protein
VLWTLLTVLASRTDGSFAAGQVALVAMVGNQSFINRNLDAKLISIGVPYDFSVTG